MSATSSFDVTATAVWEDEQIKRPIEASDLEALWQQIEAEIQTSTILVLRAAGAEITGVVGDPDGTVLVYFPPDYPHTGVGSLTSVRDAGGAQRDAWEPPVITDYLGHYTELPRWSVIPHELGREAMIDFCKRPDRPPTGIAWQSD